MRPAPRSSTVLRTTTVPAQTSAPARKAAATPSPQIKAPPPREHGRPVPTVGEGTRWAEVAPFLGFRYRKYKLSDEQQRAYNKNEMFMLSDAAIRTLARPPATTGAEQLLVALGLFWPLLVARYHHSGWSSESCALTWRLT